ncbi:DNA cytosine methyltransferase [Nocardioides pelophilus]|uniref:DNA cytosine methyltransferase n=1 Tax=Nocardioides pelophilus TaxID=2172019 RepID=UPI001601330B|nr:DNA cytosine methyltransferase [Nocardioides pelophilus]
MRKLRVIDLFAGCGGLSAGFEASGRYTPVAAVESDFQAAATYAHNFGDHVFVGDIADWADGSMPAADVVVGGPPCQGFSALGRRDPDDPRNKLWRHYVEVLSRVRPAFFVIENVPQFLGTTEFASLHAETSAGGVLASYRLETFVLNAADYGAPQARKRAVVVGRRRELSPIGPPPESARKVLGDAFPAWLDARVELNDLPSRSTEFRGKVVPGPFKLPELHFTRIVPPLSIARYRAIPPGGSRFHLPDELQTPGWRKHTRGAGDVMGRLSWDKPAVTIRTEFFKPEKGRFLHPSEHRPLTHAEAALIQGFPESFAWCGTKAAIARQIGNAVPVPLAQAIAAHLAGFMTV